MRIIDEEALACLPPHCYVYNVGRGSAIDERALADAVRDGRLAGAVLDVFNEEPLPASSELRTIPSVFVTPHASAIDPTYMELFADNFANMLRKKYSIK